MVCWPCFLFHMDQEAGDNLICLLFVNTASYFKLDGHKKAVSVMFSISRYCIFCLFVCFCFVLFCFVFLNLKSFNFTALGQQSNSEDPLHGLL